MKAERLLAILTLLLARKKVSASFLAKKLEVSVRTIYRDIDALASAGIPVFATNGRDGGFELVEGFRMDGQVLETGDIQHIIEGLNGLSGVYSGPALDSVTEKFKLLLARSGSHGIPCPENRIFIELTPSHREKRIIDLVNESIKNDTVLAIRYNGLNRAGTDREIEPLALVFVWQSWFTWAWCRLRGGFRIFRVSRITNAVEVKKRRTAPHIDLSERPWTREWESEPCERITFTAEKNALGRLLEYFDEENISERDDGTLLVSAEFPLEEWIVSWIMGLPGKTKIIEPEHLRMRVRERALSFLNENKNT